MTKLERFNTINRVAKNLADCPEHILKTIANVAECKETLVAFGVNGQKIMGGTHGDGNMVTSLIANVCQKDPIAKAYFSTALKYLDSLDEQND